jgi:hypothetical protein
LEVAVLFMIIERFKGRDPAPIYARLREQGRALPEGLQYVDSWVEANFDRCFQLMERDDALALQQWVLAWRDLADFEIVPASKSSGRCCPRPMKSGLISLGRSTDSVTYVSAAAGTQRKATRACA